MRDLIEQWKARANEHRWLGNLLVAVVIERMIEELQQRLDQLAEGLAEPSGDGWYRVEGIDEPREVSQSSDGGWRVHGEWHKEPLDGRRVWPVIDPRKGGA